jgi:hypothetical protein
MVLLLDPLLILLLLPIVPGFSIFFLFWKTKLGLCVSVYLLYKLLNACTNLYETWYIYISWHLSPSQRCTSQIPPISLCVYKCIPLSLIGNGSVRALPMTTNTQATIEELLVKVTLSLCLTNYALRHEGLWGSGRIDPRFLDLGTSWRWMVSLTLRPIYPRGKRPRYPLDRGLGGPQTWSGRCGEEKIVYLTGTRTPTPLSSSPYRGAVPTALSRPRIIVGPVVFYSVRVVSRESRRLVPPRPSCFLLLRFVLRLCLQSFSAVLCPFACDCSRSSSPFF